MNTSSNSSITVVLPGDDVTPHLPSTVSLNKVRLGTGLRYCQESKRVFATQAGKLQHHHSSCYFVQHNTKRYLPALHDRVVGVVVDRYGSDSHGGDVYRVDIGAPHPASLSSLQFEGATKRNKPMLSPGTLLYARVSECQQQQQAGGDGIKLSCQLGPRDVGLPRLDWMTQEGTYGELKGGTCVTVSLGLVRELLRPTNVVLQELSSLPFEVCLGVNGHVWVHSERPEYTILILNAIQNSQVLTEGQTKSMVKSLIQTVQRQVANDDDDDEEEGMHDQD